MRNHKHFQTLYKHILLRNILSYICVIISRVDLIALFDSSQLLNDQLKKHKDYFCVIFFLNRKVLYKGSSIHTL